MTIEYESAYVVIKRRDEAMAVWQFLRFLVLRGKLSIEEIADDTDVPLEEVRELAGLQLI